MNINCDMQTVIALKPNLTEQTLSIINKVKLGIMFLPGYGQTCYYSFLTFQRRCASAKSQNAVGGSLILQNYLDPPIQ